MDTDKYIGRLLDNRYEILEVIGTGGMAVVYKARCHRLNRLVAVKILKDDNLEDEDFRRRFHAESQAVAMLSHPNIVSVYDVSTSVMADYIVMELIEGITLKQYMAKKGTLNWKETLHFAMQIAKALEHAHSKGIVHRDIKPHNIMVLKNGSVKVMDFGIARMISHGNTLTKEALGSVHYISPEQARGGRVDDRSDLYSLGVVMYEMMAGRPPYDGESPVAVAIQHINGGAALPSTLNPNIPGGLEQIIMKAMAKNVSDRYPSATRMLADMDEFRKDPTILFDYTGLPVDAAMHVKKRPVTAAADISSGQSGKMPQLRELRQRPDELESARQREARRRQEAERRRNEHERRRQSERRSRTTTIAIIICAVVILVSIIVSLSLILSGSLRGFFSPGDKLIEVPNFVGENYAELGSVSDWEITKGKELYHESIPAGVIISQKPDAGEMVVPGKVVVDISKGPQLEEVKMEDLVTRTQDDAESRLNNLGLNLQITIKEEFNEQVAKGTVIRTDPVVGTNLTQGQTVTLYISRGKKVEISPMPNVLEQDVTAAKETLKRQDMDLIIELNEVYDMVVPEGTVMRSEPGPGEQLKTGQTVILTVSKGIERKVVPDLTGMGVAQAVNMLTGLGFKQPEIVYIPSSEAKDTVINQSLEKDKEYIITEVMTLEVSDGSLKPVEVTMDVVIDLKDRTKYSSCEVRITRDEEVVFFHEVEKGSKNIILPDQVGFGTVIYTVEVDGYGWIVEVRFSEVNFDYE